MIRRTIGRGLDKLDYLLGSRRLEHHYACREIPEARGYLVYSLNFEEGEKILDVGNYTGRNLPNIHYYPPQGDVTVLVQNRVARRHAKEHIEKSEKKNIECVEGSETHIPFPNDFFDKVSLPYVFSSRPDVRENIMKEVVRVTKPQGLIGVLDYRFGKTLTYESIMENLFSFPLQSIKYLGFKGALEELATQSMEDFSGDSLGIDWANSFPFLDKIDTQVFSEGGTGWYDGLRLRSYLFRLNQSGDDLGTVIYPDAFKPKHHH